MNKPKSKCRRVFISNTDRRLITQVYPHHIKQDIMSLGFQRFVLFAEYQVKKDSLALVVCML